MSIPQDKIDTVRDLASIVDVVSGYVSLKRAGANYVGLCPFHTEKTPSFTVSEQKKIFHCFGCQTGGNVFTFLMKIKGLSFPDAVRELAARYGVSIPRATPTDRREEDRRKRVFSALGHAAAYFQRQLNSPKGAGTRGYLEKRSIKEETMEAFRLGLAPKEWEGLTSYLVGKGVSLKDAQAAGLVVEGRMGPRDRFVERLMFPITDQRGRVVGFGGRDLGSDSKKVAKYINTPEGPLFKKSRLLYGLAQAADEIRTLGLALVVEGYMDLIALWQAGIKNVVAPLGTALTSGQARLISRFAGKATVVFDGDDAGKNAAMRSLEVLLKEGIEPYIALLPAGMDPDDFIGARGPDELKKLIEGADSLVSFFVGETAKAAGRSVRDRADALKKAGETIALVPDPVAKSIYLRDLAQKLGVPEDAILARPQARRGRPQTRGRPKPGPKSGEYVMVAALFKDPGLAGQLRESGVLDLFKDDALKRAAGLIMARAERGLDIDPASLPDEQGDPELHSRLVELYMYSEHLKEEDMRNLFADKLKAAAQEAERIEREARLADLQEKIAAAEEAGDWDLHRKYLLEISAISGKRASRG